MKKSKKAHKRFKILCQASWRKIKQKPEYAICGVIFFLIVLLLPWIFSLPYSLGGYGENTGTIGDTIGGTTAPFIGLVSIILLFYTLKEQQKFNYKQQKFNDEQQKFNQDQQRFNNEQLKFNQDQKEIEYDEQFKSTLFSLLQVQRDITNNISGLFYTWDKEGKKEEHKVKGFEFFSQAKIQLKLLFDVFYNEKYNSKIHKYEIMDDKNIDYNHKNIRKYYRMGYDLYNKRDSKSKPRHIIFVYIIFYLQYEQIGYYFRHLYKILSFISDTEKEKIKRLGENITEEKAIFIKKQYKEYASIVVSSMSAEEKTFMFYDSLMYSKMQNLIIKYDLLDNLRISQLIRKEHNIIPKYKLADIDDKISEIKSMY